MQILQGHTAPIRRVAYSPDGTMLASCGEDNAIRLWDLASGAEVVAMAGRRRPNRLQVVYDIAFSPDGTRLVSGDHAGFLTLWSVPDGSQIEAVEDGTSGVSSVAFRRDGTRLLSGSLRGTMTCRDFSGRSGIGAVRWTFEPQARAPTAHEPPVPVWCVAFEPIGRFAVLGPGSERADIPLVLPKSRRPFARLEVPIRVRAVEFSHGGAWLAVASGRKVYTWAVRDAPKAGKAPVTVEARAELVGHEATIRGLAFGPDGRMIVTASYDGTVRLWDVEEGAERCRFDWGIGRTDCVACSPDGLTLAAGGERDVILWDADARI